jgi:signal peptide peptidase SppA
MVLAIEPRTWAAMREVLARAASGIRVAPGEAAARAGLAVRPSAVRPSGAVQVIPLIGLLSHRGGDLLSFLFGGTPLVAVQAALRQAAADPAVAAIVLDVDSPGGEVFGVEETAATVADVARRKPVVAVANAMAARAAYWIAAAATELVVTPSGQVGSVGIVAVHTDVSQAQEQAGIRTTLISSAPRKADGTPFVPLSDRARADLQARVDAYGDLFVTRVASGRGVAADRVRREFGEGRVVGAAEALRRRMVDRVEAFEATLARVAARPPAPAGARGLGAAAELDRRRRLAALAWR